MGGREALERRGITDHTACCDDVRLKCIGYYFYIMGRAGIQEEIIGGHRNSGYIVHFNPYALEGNFALMFTVCCQETGGLQKQAQAMGIGNDASAAVTAQTGFPAIGVEIPHLEIVTRTSF